MEAALLVLAHCTRLLCNVHSGGLMGRVLDLMGRWDGRSRCVLDDGRSRRVLNDGSKGVLDNSGSGGVLNNDGSYINIFHNRRHRTDGS